MKIEENKSLKEFNTFGLESKASQFLELRSVEEASTFFKQSNTKKDNLLILGGGSNILLTKDFEGLVLKVNIEGIELIKQDEAHVWLSVGAGENWHEFVMYCIEHNYSGIENLSLIPGNVGASPMQNIGAYGVEVKDVIESVECIKRSNGEVKVFINEDCQFAYRSSIFKTSAKDEYLISKVIFKLSLKPNFKTSYGAIQEQLKQDRIAEENLTIRAVSNAVIAIRQSKLPDPKEIGNSGSFFKNPVVSKELHNALKKEYGTLPAYPLMDGTVKLAAGWLIEQAGWKGYREGDFGVHAKQALVLVNYGQAKGNDIYELSSRIVKSIQEKFGIELEREVNII